jgi:hypothetical protein
MINIGLKQMELLHLARERTLDMSSQDPAEISTYKNMTVSTVSNHKWVKQGESSPANGGDFFCPSVFV